MKKEEVIAKLKEYEGRVIEVGLADEGAMLYGGINGHWLFTKDDNLIEVKINSGDGTYGFSTINQQQSPYLFTVVQFDSVNYIRTPISRDPGDIASMLAGATPAGINKSLEEVIKDMQSNDVLKANSPRGMVNDPGTIPGTIAGPFRGSYISTTSDGLPKFANDLVNKETK